MLDLRIVQNVLMTLPVARIMPYQGRRLIDPVLIHMIRLGQG